MLPLCRLQVSCCEITLPLGGVAGGLIGDNATCVWNGGSMQWYNSITV